MILQFYYLSVNHTLKHYVMKLILRIVSISFLGLLSFSSAFAQINEYFLNNPVWKMTSVCAVGYPCIQNEEYNYYVNGDTVLNSLTYKKVFRKGQGNYQWFAGPPIGCSGSYSYVDTIPYRFLRSDGKKVFMKIFQDTTDYLLYNFDLSVGDTLPLTYNNYATDVTVTAIDSFYYGNGYRKLFSLAGNTWAQYLIEGVGHSKGLFEPLNVPLECGFNLECYSLNDSSYYPVLGPTCELSIGIPKNEELILYSVSPNPFTSFTTITFERTLNNAMISIYNIYGQKVLARSGIYDNKFVVERNNLSSGVYSFVVKQKGDFISRGKLIIRD
jgi:Secretion system C-terminal sorting domain